MPDEPAAPQRRSDDQLDQALAQAPWWVRLGWYAARDFWDWLTGAFALVGTALPLISEYIDQHPDDVQFLTSTQRHYAAAGLLLAIFVFNVMSIIKKGKN